MRYPHVTIVTLGAFYFFACAVLSLGISLLGVRLLLSLELPLLISFLFFAIVAGTFLFSLYALKVGQQALSLLGNSDPSL